MLSEKYKNGIGEIHMTIFEDLGRGDCTLSLGWDIFRGRTSCIAIWRGQLNHRSDNVILFWALKFSFRKTVSCFFQNIMICSMS